LGITRYLSHPRDECRPAAAARHLLVARGRGSSAFRGRALRRGVGRHEPRGTVDDDQTDAAVANLRRTTCRSPGTPPRPCPGQLNGSRARSTSTRRRADRAIAAAGRERPLHPWGANRLAHPPLRPDNLDHRRRQPLPAPWRGDRGHPPGRPCLLRARRRPLARRHLDPLHDPSRDARGRRPGQPRHLGRARHGRGVRRGFSDVAPAKGELALRPVVDAPHLHGCDVVVEETLGEGRDRIRMFAVDHVVGGQMLGRRVEQRARSNERLPAFVIPETRRLIGEGEAGPVEARRTETAPDGAARACA
jgi:hypothetical protein